MNNDYDYDFDDRESNESADLNRGEVALLYEPRSSMSMLSLNTFEYVDTIRNARTHRLPATKIARDVAPMSNMSVKAPG